MAFTTEDKVALLLTSLGEETAQAVLEKLDASKSSRVRQRMQRVNHADAAGALEEVLSELGNLLSEEATSAAGGGRSAKAREWEGRTGGSAKAKDEAAKSEEAPAEIPTESTDLVAEMRRTPPEQIAAMLQGEHSGVACFVLQCLDAEQASEVLRRLPTEVRQETFLRLGPGGMCSTEVLSRILRALFQKQRAVSDSPIEPSSQDDRLLKMAAMLRSLEPQSRTEMLNALEEQDAEMAGLIKDRLYTFEDLLHIADTSIQKMLMEVDMRTLATALATSPVNLKDRVLRNLSKRAREMLYEEMNLLGTVAPGKIQESQKAMVMQMQRLDQSGELIMV